MNLSDEYKRIKENHRQAIIVRVARVCFSGSTGRVFPGRKRKGEKSANDIIKEALTKIDVDNLVMIKTQSEFRGWFNQKLDVVTNAIPPKSSHDKLITNAARRWGYGAKILCLFLRDMVDHCRYFNEDEIKEVRKFLYVPIDSIIIDKLVECGETLPFNNIEEIDSEDKFYSVQDKLIQAAQIIDVPRIWFDDNWGDRQ